MIELFCRRRQVRDLLLLLLLLGWHPEMPQPTSFAMGATIKDSNCPPADLYFDGQNHLTTGQVHKLSLVCELEAAEAAAASKPLID